MLVPSVSIQRRIPTSRPRSPVRVPLGAPNESEQSNKQSALALLAKPPPRLFSLLFCRGSMPVQVESTTIPVGPGHGLSFSSNACPLPLSPPSLSPFRLEAPLPRSASWRLYPVPPRGASTLFLLSGRAHAPSPKLSRFPRAQTYPTLASWLGRHNSLSFVRASSMLVCNALIFASCLATFSSSASNFDLGTVLSCKCKFRTWLSFGKPEKPSKSISRMTR
jgi:hypothetical protein